MADDAARKAADIAARKKAHKKAKRARQARDRLGTAFVPQEQFGTLQERKEAALHTKKLQHMEEATRLPRKMVPADCHFKDLSTNMVEYFASPSFTVLSKGMDPKALRAAWFNNIDPSHCFDVRKSKIAAANVGLVQYCLAKDQAASIPPLLIPFSIACHEHKVLKVRFADREAFIEAWISSPSDHDLITFSRKEVGQFNKMVGDLRAALPQIDGDDPVLQQEGQKEGIDLDDLRQALADDIGDLNDEGEKMAQQVPVENETGELSDLKKYEFEKYQSVYLARPVEDRPAVYSAWVNLMLEEMSEEVTGLLKQDPQDKELITAFYMRIVNLISIRAMRTLAVVNGYSAFSELA